MYSVISLLYFLLGRPLNSTLPLKKRSLWSLERALSFQRLPPHQVPEPQGSTLRLWSTAPKTLTLLTLKVPLGAPCAPPVCIRPSACLFHCFTFLMNGNASSSKTGKRASFHCRHLCPYCEKQTSNSSSTDVLHQPIAFLIVGSHLCASGAQ